MADETNRDRAKARRSRRTASEVDGAEEPVVMVSEIVAWLRSPESGTTDMMGMALADEIERRWGRG